MNIVLSSFIITSYSRKVRIDRRRFDFSVDETGKLVMQALSVDTLVKFYVHPYKTPVLGTNVSIQFRLGNYPSFFHEDHLLLHLAPPYRTNDALERLCSYVL